jgi:hypothetical protein
VNRCSLATTLFAETDYKVVGLALVFKRSGDCDPTHQDKFTGWGVYQMGDPAPGVPGGLHLLFRFTPGRQMHFSRRVGRVLVPEQLPDGCATAQAVGQSARAAGAPRYKGGPRGDLFHARINSRSGGGAAGPEQAPQQPRVQVTLRLDVRLPGCRGEALPVPNIHTFAYNLFHLRESMYIPGHSYGAGRGGGRQPPPKVSEAERLSKLHCGCCMTQLTERHAPLKALNKGATYWVCWACDKKPGSKLEWLCPTAAEGTRGCLCCAPPKQAEPSWQGEGKRAKWRSKRKLYASPKALKALARRLTKLREGAEDEEEEAENEDEDSGNQ